MFGKKAPKGAAVTFHGAIPILRVGNLASGVDYYVNVLGFEVDWREPGIIASVSRGRCCVFLTEGDQGNPGSWIYVGVGNVETLFEEFRAKGAKVRHPPTNHPWGYEMQVEDPDGNVLRFASDSKEGQPFGEWLDMRGTRWVKSAAGGWTRVEGAKR